MNSPVRSFDWKFIISSGLAVAGLVLSVWIWQSDFSARSLSVKVSTVPLQVPFPDTVPDVQVNISGVVVKSPYISIISLTNDGKRPIPTNDFESPILFEVSSGADVVRANLSETWPKNLYVKFVTSPRDVTVTPMLLNPGDTLDMAVITSGMPPTFKTTARIAGISQITVEDGAVARATLYDKMTSVFSVVTLPAGYGIFALAFFWPGAITLNRGIAGMACFAFGLSIAHSTKFLFAAFGIPQSLYWQGGTALAVTLPVFFYLRNRYARTLIGVP